MIPYDYKKMMDKSARNEFIYFLLLLALILGAGFTLILTIGMGSIEHGVTSTEDSEIPTIVETEFDEEYSKHLLVIKDYLGREGIIDFTYRVEDDSLIVLTDNSNIYYKLYKDTNDKFELNIVNYYTNEVMSTVSINLE